MIFLRFIFLLLASSEFLSAQTNVEILHSIKGYYNNIINSEYTAKKETILSDAFVKKQSLEKTESKIAETERVRFGSNGNFFIETCTYNSIGEQLFGSMSAWDGNFYQIYRKDSKMLALSTKYKQDNYYLSGKFWALLPFWWMQPETFSDLNPEKSFDTTLFLPENISKLDNNFKKVNIVSVDNDKAILELVQKQAVGELDVRIVIAKISPQYWRPTEITRYNHSTGIVVDRMTVSWRDYTTNNQIIIPQSIILDEYSKEGNLNANSVYTFNNQVFCNLNESDFQIPHSIAKIISEEDSGKTIFKDK